MEKLLLFLAFLVVYGLYLASSAILINRFLAKLKPASLIENEILIIVPYLFFFAFVFLIGRFFNLQLLTLSILFSNIGLIITVIVWNLIGSPLTPFKEISGWAGGDFAMKNIWLTLVSQGIVLLLFIVFPILIGIVFFSHSSEEAIRIDALKYSLILLLAAYILTLPILIGVLTSRFIDEDSRARFFINQFSGLIAYSLFVSLLFWIFNFGSPGNAVQMGNLNLSLSPRLLMIIMSFMIVFLLLPYFIGIQRAKRLKSDFLETNRRLLSNIIEEINLSTEITIIAKIESLQKQIIDEFNKLSESDEGIKMGLRFDATNSENDLQPNEVLLYNYYKKARSYDSRFGFYDFLNDTYLDLEALKTLEFEQQNSTDKKLVQDKYIAHFKSFKDDLSTKNDAGGRSNPALWIGIITILSPVLSQVMSAVGKYLIDIFKNV
jgi:hypothetical protein